MNLLELVPAELLGTLRTLARVGTWFRIRPFAPSADGLPRTDIEVDWVKLNTSPFAADPNYRMFRKLGYVHLFDLEAKARAVADGPKLFVPSADQFEAMEHVEIHLPVADFRSPFPMLFIRIPAERRRAAAESSGVPIDRIPLYVSVRDRFEPGDAVRAVLVTTRFGIREQSQIFSDNPGNPDIEAAITRRVFKKDEANDPAVVAEFDVGETFGRAALNLCLMLTHYGCKIGGPAEPSVYARHRAKKHLAHLAAADFLTVQMTQNIRLRDDERRVPAAAGDVALGGYEVRPHWRKGHWRAMRGYGERRRAGVAVPLSFVRPTLVRSDRTSGDLGESRVIYHG